MVVAPVSSKVGDGLLNLRHLVTQKDIVVVEVIKLLLESALHTFKSLADGLSCSPMLSTRDEIFIPIENGIALIAGGTHVGS